jgi:hypothetical protein
MKAALLLLVILLAASFPVALQTMDSGDLSMGCPVGAKCL